ncbi:8-oxo-dGTP pyrophosphatase MutT (NUDIX family) [Paraburkholderia sp. Clong3]
MIREPDGRVWIVAPTNGFGGYQATFPKGTVSGKSMQATAMAEAFEESGLKVRLTSHLVDVKRSQSYTRYYLAERLDGNPADMGWESQAVLLVPTGQLATVLNHRNDKPIIEALKKEGV